MNQNKHQVCLLLGSNIQPEKNIPLCIGLLREQLTVFRISSVWESQAIGSDGPNFLNVALVAFTSMDAAVIKEQVIRPLEAQLGRVRTQDKNAPRTIDVDLILFDHQLLDANLWQYAYRAVPVAEVLPAYPSQTGVLLKDAASLLMGTTAIWVRPDVAIHPFQTASFDRP